MMTELVHCMQPPLALLCRPLCTKQRVVAVAMVFVVILSTLPATAGKSSPPSEHDVKAAFLYNFASFVEWPANAFSSGKDPLIIGVAGDDPFGESLDKATEGRNVRGRRLEVKRFRSKKDIDACHILFVSSSEKRHIKEIIEAVEGKPVLTVGETDGFAKDGGIINFYIDKNKIRFEISNNNAKRARLKISSKLLSLARLVEG